MERFAAPEAGSDDVVGFIVDPCDGCGGSAVLTATFVSGVLVFCRSCWYRHEDAIRGSAETIHG